VEKFLRGASADVTSSKCCCDNFITLFNLSFVKFAQGVVLSRRKSGIDAVGNITLHQVNRANDSLLVISNRYRAGAWIKYIFDCDFSDNSNNLKFLNCL
jgi:hypothetical protein